MLTRAEIEEKLREILRETSGDEKARSGFTEESRLIEDMGLTSVDMLYLIIATEESFGIRFENIGVLDLPTVGDVIRYIEKKLG